MDTESSEGDFKYLVLRVRHQEYFPYSRNKEIPEKKWSRCMEGGHKKTFLMKIRKVRRILGSTEHIFLDLYYSSECILRSTFVKKTDPFPKISTLS